MKKILDSLNAPSSIGLFNVSRRQSLKRASHEKSPRRSDQGRSVVTSDSSEKSGSDGSGHRSGSGGSQGGDYRGSGATSNGRSDAGHSPSDEKVSSVAFYLYLYLPFFSLSGLVNFGISMSIGKNLISGSAVALCSFEHTFSYPGSSEVVVGRSSTSICLTATKSAPCRRHFLRPPGMI